MYRADMSIIFVLPPTSGPSGGIKTLLEHAAVLQEAGHDAFVYDPKDSFSRDYGINVPVERRSLELCHGDIVVRGEVFHSDSFKRTAATGAKQVLFVQNHYYLANCLRYGRDFRHLGVQAVAASSRPIADFLLRHRIADEVSYLPYAVSAPEFLEKLRVLRIAYMPRKLQGIGTIIKRLFPILNPDLASVEWKEISGLPHRDVMRELATSAVFLSLQAVEGFGMPALEAMASGCLVVGFTGGRGCEYAEKSNALWVAENDIEIAVLALGRAIRWIHSGAPEAKEMIAAGRRTASRYSVEARNRAVLAFYNQVIASSR